jgi:hypothetical protein
MVEEFTFLNKELFLQILSMEFAAERGCDLHWSKLIVLCL